MSASIKRALIILLIAVGPVALAAESRTENPDAPARSNDVLDILLRSKKIQQEKTADKSTEPDGEASSQTVQQARAAEKSEPTEKTKTEQPAKPGDLNPPAPPAPTATPAPESKPASAPAAEPQTQTPAATTTTAATYTIESGDTFSSIASKLYHDEKKWTAIAQANPLVDPARLKVGQVIRLPDLAKFAQQREQQLDAIKQAVAKPAAESKTIIVQPGDTLTHIARRVYGKAGLWEIIFNANKNQLETPDKLKVGMKLTIPPKPTQ